jgi:hypothetical protein
MGSARVRTGLSVSAAIAAAAIGCVGWVSAESLPPAATKAQRSAFERTFSPGAGLCVDAGGVEGRCDAIPAASAASMHSLRAAVIRFARCMSRHRAPVGQPYFSYKNGGFSVSFPSYDVHRARFRLAYVRCKPLLEP